jgi:hypothetical protein
MEQIERWVTRYPRLFKGSAPRCRSEVQPGWASIVEHALCTIDQHLNDEQAAHLEVMQIKEKLGGLRIYLNLGNDPMTLEVRAVAAPTIQSAELQAKVTCTECGQPGKLRELPHRGLEVLCDIHGQID